MENYNFSKRLARKPYECGEVTSPVHGCRDLTGMRGGPGSGRERPILCSKTEDSFLEGSLWLYWRQIETPGCPIQTEDRDLESSWSLRTRRYATEWPPRGDLARNQGGHSEPFGINFANILTNLCLESTFWAPKTLNSQLKCSLTPRALCGLAAGPGSAAKPRAAVRTWRSGAGSGATCYCEALEIWNEDPFTYVDVYKIDILKISESSFKSEIY